MLRVLDLFSGMGGFSLGLEATKGFETIAFCEIDPFCRKVLAKHWPDVPCFEDITKLEMGELNGLGKVDVICGGFPCQDISCAGKGAGIHAARSGLWWEMLRIIRLVRPRYVLVENVAALLNRGLDEVLGSLAESGYDAEWNIVSAASVGAPHLRKRVFIVAYARQFLHPGIVQTPPREERWGATEPDICGQDVADSKSKGFEESERTSGNEPGFTGSKCDCLPARGATSCGPIISRLGGAFDGLSQRLDGPWCNGWEDGTPRTATGQKYRVNRLRALGNAIVPQCAQCVGECVLVHERMQSSDIVQ